MVIFARLDRLTSATYCGHDLLTGRLQQTIEDIDDATADGLSLTIPAGWTLPASAARTSPPSISSTPSAA